MATQALAVVIPARNEEARLGRCLTALQASISHFSSGRHASVAVRVVVVLDRCTDDTESVARGFAGVEVVHSQHGQVGPARALGVRHVLGLAGPERVMTDWIACTDADSQVPIDWLDTHWWHAQAGVDLMLGTVRPDPSELSRHALWAWRHRHDLADGHPHIHGANLGVRPESYLRAGGFADVAVHEDVLLVGAVRDLGGRVVSTGRSPVVTSARLAGRTPAGMATYLRDMMSEPA